MGDMFDNGMSIDLSDAGLDAMVSVAEQATAEQGAADRANALQPAEESNGAAEHENTTEEMQEASSEQHPAAVGEPASPEQQEPLAEEKMEKAAEKLYTEAEFQARVKEQNRGMSLAQQEAARLRRENAEMQEQIKALTEQQNRQPLTQEEVEAKVKLMVEDPDRFTAEMEKRLENRLRTEYDRKLQEERNHNAALREISTAMEDLSKTWPSIKQKENLPAFTEKLQEVSARLGNPNLYREPSSVKDVMRLAAMEMWGMPLAANQQLLQEAEQRGQAQVLQQMKQAQTDKASAPLAGAAPPAREPGPDDDILAGIRSAKPGGLF